MLVTLCYMSVVPVQHLCMIQYVDRPAAAILQEPRCCSVQQAHCHHEHATHLQHDIQYDYCPAAPCNCRNPAVAALYHKHIATMTMQHVCNMTYSECHTTAPCNCRSPAVAALYRRHITTMTGRVSSISGVARKDDPAILGWDVFNEPRWGTTVIIT
jgi:hypothetical protein